LSIQKKKTLKRVPKPVSISDFCGLNVIIDNRVPKNTALIINNGKLVGKIINVK